MTFRAASLENGVTMNRMGISAFESLMHIAAAATISTALLGVGLRGAVSGPSGTGVQSGKSRRRTRWPSLLGGVLGVAMTVIVGVLDDTRSSTLLDTTSTVIAVAVGAAVIPVAIFLVRLGLRGRRVGDHPYCRACGFDLFGRPETSTLCAECGAALDLQSDKKISAIVVGMRHRRMVPLLTGVFALIVAIAVLVPKGRDGFVWAREHDWSPWMPESWLLSDFAKYKAELGARINHGTLSRAGINRYIELHFPPAKPGDSSPQRWAGLNDATFAAGTAWRDNLIDEQRVRDVLKASLEIHLTLASRAEQQQVVRYDIRPVNGYLIMYNAPSAFALSLAITDRTDSLAGIEVPVEARSTCPLDSSRWDLLPEQGSSLALSKMARPVPLGPATFETNFTASVTLTVAGRPSLTESAPIVLTGTTTIVPPGTLRCPPVKDAAVDVSLPIDDPINAAVIANAPLADPDPAPEVKTEPGNDGKPYLAFWGTTRGAILGDATLRSGGVDRPLGPIFIEASRSCDIPIDHPPASPYDIIITPRPELGAQLFQQPPTFQKVIVIHSSPAEAAD